MKFGSKGFSHHVLILVIVVVAAVGGAGYYVWSKRDKASDSAPAASESAPAAVEEEAAACTAPAGYLVYDNSDVRFCFVYPEAWGTVTLHNGILDPAQETGSGYLGTFSDEENASFAFQSDDWAYTGPGRGGPNHASGFATFEVFAPSAGDSTNYAIKVNTAEKQLVAATTMFNFDGVTVWAKKPFVESEPYTGLEIQLNVPATGAFDFETDEPDTIVSAEQYTQMNTILDSITEY